MQTHATRLKHSSSTDRRSYQGTRPSYPEQAPCDSDFRNPKRQRGNRVQTHATRLKYNSSSCDEPWTPRNGQTGKTAREEPSEPWGSQEPLLIGEQRLAILRLSVCDRGDLIVLTERVCGRSWVTAAGLRDREGTRMVRRLIRNQLPGNRLRVRIPCPPPGGAALRCNTPFSLEKRGFAF